MIDHTFTGHGEFSRCARLVNCSNLSNDGRLLMRFVLGVKNPLRHHLITGLQARLLAGDSVLNKKDAVAALKQALTKFHNDPHGCRGYETQKLGA
jgi:hypothetical protein